MNKEQARNIRCVVSGSFSKFKPEIDQAIDHLTELGVKVLVPDKGWLAKPRTELYSPTNSEFRPLPTETHLSIRQIEDSFLNALRISDFLYVVNPDGYVGNSASMEIGVALALSIPVFAQEPISHQLDPDPIWTQRISQIRILNRNGQQNPNT